MTKVNIQNFWSLGGLLGVLLIFRGVLLILVQRQRSFDDVAAVDGSATIQIFYTLICFGLSFNYLINSGFAKHLLTKTPLRIMLYFHLLGLVSIFWSVNPSMTGYRAFEAIAYSILIIAVFVKLSERLDFTELVRWLIYFAVFSIIVGAMARGRLWGVGMFSIRTLLAEQFNSTPYFFYYY